MERNRFGRIQITPGHKQRHGTIEITISEFETLKNNIAYLEHVLNEYRTENSLLKGNTNSLAYQELKTENTLLSADNSELRRLLEVANKKFDSLTDTIELRNAEIRGLHIDLGLERKSRVIEIHKDGKVDYVASKIKKVDIVMEELIKAHNQKLIDYAENMDKAKQVIFGYVKAMAASAIIMLILLILLFVT